MITILTILASAALTAVLVYFTAKLYLDEPLSRKDYLIIAAMSLANAASAYLAILNTETYMDALNVIVASIAVSTIVLIDKYKFIIPNKIIIAFLITRIVLFVIELFTNNAMANVRSLVTSIVSAVVVVLFMLLVRLIAKGGIGLGDVKVLGAIAFMTGLWNVVFALLFGSVVSCLYVGGMLLAKKITKKEKIAFGPFIYIGLVISIIVGAF
ncbi:MAG: A24 family peptidase [Lactobacillales bacterium]|jgi:prepilin signal peptidase PulO-like enzyme (type II secretory pathway)|nr:A24 family peptidase [Lactobacillales bacterium]